MDQISVDNGKYNFIAQLPQIIYSSLITSVVNFIIKTLSLSEKDILSVKEEDNFTDAVKKSKTINNKIKIKFIIFYIISIIFMIIFWYFISCFCAVYRNTQLILIEDTIISFIISMLYPFGIQIFSGWFRIPALKAEKKDKKVMYQISKILAIF